MRDQLERAFAILLGKPLAEFPLGTYELWFWVDPDLLDPSTHAVARTRDELVHALPDAPSATFDCVGEWWERYGVDYARSLYVFDDDGVAYHLEQALPVMQQHGWAHDGPELVALAQRSDLALDALLGASWYIVRRAVTDGSLFDAMAAATCSSSAPRHLLSRADAGASMVASVIVDPVWQAKLAAIEDPVLREHVEMSCVDGETGRWFGAYLPHQLRVDMRFEQIVARGREPVACWYVGEGQAARGVFRVTSTA